MRILLKINQLFFNEDEVTNSDIVVYTVGATIGLTMFYLKLF